jgi:hypothetical protein
MRLLHYATFSSNNHFLLVRHKPISVCDISHTASGNNTLITYIYSPDINDPIINILILNDIITDIINYLDIV